MNKSGPVVPALFRPHGACVVPHGPWVPVLLDLPCWVPCVVLSPWLFRVVKTGESSTTQIWGVADLGGRPVVRKFFFDSFPRP